MFDWAYLIMLLTLTASCLRSLLVPAPRSKKPKMDLLDLPAFTRDTLQLSGSNLSTDLLVGANRTRLEAIRERADRASCSCLLLIEHDPQNFGSKDERLGLAAAERMARVVDAAQILGCSAASVKITAVDDDETLLLVASRLKPIMERAEKLDINLVVSPHVGLTSRADRVTDLLKKVGGFRIGTYPDFETAAQATTLSSPPPSLKKEKPSKDGKEKPAKEAEPKNLAVSYLHRLTPYASAVCASTTGFCGSGKSAADANPESLKNEKHLQHVAYELKPLLEAVISVGYDGPLALDYRGPGDVIAGLALSRAAIQTALGLDEPDDDDLGLDDDLLDPEEPGVEPPTPQAV